jgi:dTDP-4-dehydrorhamnose reductase
MKVVVLGVGGMLGHKVLDRLSGRFTLIGTLRDQSALPVVRRAIGPAVLERIVSGANALEFESVSALLARLRPQAVINCIGIVKQRDEARNAARSIRVNSLFPHLLADFCVERNIRLIHVSTDCVFSGRAGNYAESDLPDPPDLYGRSKLLGEVNREGCLTLRTSIVGWELQPGKSLLEWFAAQRGRRIEGYRQAIYSGLATSTLADLIGDLIENWPGLSGLYHVASSPISKYDLLVGLRRALDWQDIEIVPNDEFRIDRSLDGSQFEARTGWRAPGWDEMIATLSKEWPAYERAREGT